MAAARRHQHEVLQRTAWRPGHPAVEAEVRNPIRRLSVETCWGAPRVHGELSKFGYDVAGTTAGRNMARCPGPQTRSSGSSTCARCSRWTDAEWFALS